MLKLPRSPEFGALQMCHQNDGKVPCCMPLLQADAMADPITAEQSGSSLQIIRGRRGRR